MLKRILLIGCILVILIANSFSTSLAQEIPNGDLCIVMMHEHLLITSEGDFFETQGDLFDYTFSPEGLLIYSNMFWSTDHGIFRQNIETGEESVIITDGADDLTDFAYLDTSSDGRLAFVATKGDDEFIGRVYKLYVLSGYGREEYNVDGFGPDWSPDNKSIVFYTENTSEHERQIQIIDLATGKVSTIAEGIDPQWSPDGTRIAYTTTYYGEIVVYNISDGTSEILPPKNVWGFYWIDDTTLLYSGSIVPNKPNSIWTYDLVNNMATEVYRLEGNNLVDPSLCP